MPNRDTTINRLYYLLMKLKNLVNSLCFLLLFPAMVHSQVLDQLVTLHYDAVRLDYALRDIGERYQVNFVYSKSKIPVSERVTTHVIERSLEEALTELFFTTQIEFHLIGSQIALSVNENKEIGLLSQVEEEEEDKWDGVLRSGMVTNPYTKAENSTPIYTTSTDNEQTVPIYTTSTKIENTSVILEEPIVEIIEKDTVTIYLSDNEFLETIPLKKEVKKLPETQTLFKAPAFKKSQEKIKKFLKGQVSLWPALGTNELFQEDETNNVSINILWGKNKNLEGLEIGLVNSIENNVKGAQISGLGNTVGGQVVGSQLTAGLNYTQGKMTGFQGAGLGNIALEESKLTQVAGLFNYSQKSVSVQVSNFINIAEEVEYGQIAMVNKATTVQGFQIGLINVADTVQGVSIGLLNLVESGYNRIQIAGNRDGLHATLGLKLGTKRFYNIFQTGIRVDNFVRRGDGSPAIDEVPAWGLGYGLGTAITLNNRFLINIEMTLTHINENTFWTKKLNLLSQLHVTLDTRITNRISFFAGPTLNIMNSKLFNPETQEYGSSIAGHTFTDQTSYNDVNAKAWFGASAGLRF